MRPRAGEPPTPLSPPGPRGPVPDEPPAPPALDLRERRVLQVGCDTLVPRVRVDADPGGFYERTATDLGVDEDVERIVLEYVSPEQREDFRTLLRTFDSRLVNLLFAGLPCRFTGLREELRERYLLGWAHSRLAVRRRGFHALKRLVLFLTYAKVLANGANPNWRGLGPRPPPPPPPPPPPAPRPRRAPPRSCESTPFGRSGSSPSPPTSA